MIILLLLFLVAPTNGVTNSSLKTEPNSPARNNDADKDEYDFMLARKIRSQIIKNKNFSRQAREIRVSVVNGEILLKGFVNSKKEQNEVEALAKKSAGQYSLLNKTRISP